MARVMHANGLSDAAERMGKDAETHATLAIALDELEGLPAWATRDLVTQLTRSFEEKAGNQEAVREIAAKHNEMCVALTNRLEEISRDISRRKLDRAK